MQGDLQLKPDRRPNVIWFLVDQMRAHALSLAGDRNVHTPNIDNLAREGMRFSGAVSGSPWCCPFRGALLTGKYPHQNGVSATPLPMDPSLPTISAPFQEAGYHTAWVGKWYLDGSNSREHFVPPERRGGFDYWLGYENNNNQNEVFVFGNGHEDEPRRLEGYETDSLTDCLCDHLYEHVSEGRANDGDYQPFFACLSVQPPHDPYIAPTNPEYPHSRLHPEDLSLRPNVPPGGGIEAKARRDLAGYYGMIENIDHNLGRLRQFLKEMDLDRETWVIFFSDHGDMVGSHGQWGKSAPWEESIRIPFVVGHLGGNVHMRTGECAAPLNHVDIGPTTLGLCGIEAPDWMVGHDFSPRCRHGGTVAPASEPQSAFLQQIPAKRMAHTVNRPWRGVVTGDGWKYACMPGQDWLLHDLNEDPYELANLAFNPVHAEKRRELHALLQQWISDTSDTFDLPQLEPEIRKS